MKVTVLVRPKAGILDPQGQAVERALPALGFSGVGQVHVGRLIELELEDAGQVPAMCEALLTNPLIEDYEVQEAGQSPAGQASREGEQAHRDAGLEAPRR